MVTIHSQAVTEILAPYWIPKFDFPPHSLKGLMHSFPMMYNTMGSTFYCLGGRGQFLNKKCLKKGSLGGDESGQPGDPSHQTKPDLRHDSISGTYPWSVILSDLHWPSLSLVSGCQMTQVNIFWKRFLLVEGVGGVLNTNPFIKGGGLWIRPLLVGDGPLFLK